MKKGVPLPVFIVVILVVIIVVSAIYTMANNKTADVPVGNVSAPSLKGMKLPPGVGTPDLKGMKPVPTTPAPAAPAPPAAGAKQPVKEGN